MPDISEIWDNLGYLIAPAVALLFFYFGRRIQSARRRLLVRGGALILLGISGLAFAFEVYALTALTLRKPAVESPDREHIAVVYWTGVLFDENCTAEAHVQIRKRLSPFPSRIWEESVVAKTTSELLTEPKLTWLDARRILISTRQDGPIKECPSVNARTADIQVLCQY